MVWDGALLAGEDIPWHLGQVHGHDRHVWVMDDWELGRVVASALHMENVWVGGAEAMVRYYDMTGRADRWLATPEGQAALDAAATAARRIL